MGQLKIYLKERLTRFRGELKKVGLDGYIIDQPKDVYYFLGLKMSQALVLITESQCLLFADSRYLDEVETKYERTPLTGLERLDSKKIESFLHLCDEKVFGYDTSTSVDSFNQIKQYFRKAKIKLRGLKSPLQRIQAVKDSYEIDCLKKSTQLVLAAYKHILNHLKSGITEESLALELEIFVLRNGGEGLSFPPIIAFGENSAYPHHKSGSTKLKKGDIVLIDVGVVVNGYSSDLTRTIFYGEGSLKLMKMQHVVEKAFHIAQKECYAGNKVKVLDKAVRKFFGHEEKYFIHALGHGIGLNVHEYPRISQFSRSVKLEEGMVITIEPGLYIPGIGGIRYEDMLLITRSGSLNFYKDFE